MHEAFSALALPTHAIRLGRELGRGVQSVVHLGEITLANVRKVWFNVL